ncbi:MAG: hypothetical protein NC453_30930 [Muribaculum sp.]|nr:hypothetical protein [Muribaculum sp.]
MGANGSKASGALENSQNREFDTQFFISKNIEVVQLRNANQRVRLPEESHTPNRVYVVFNKDGTLKSIGRYGSDCLKKFEMHFDHEHDGLQPHYHKWVSKGGTARGPETKGSGKNSRTIAHPFTKGMMKLYTKVKYYAP